MSTKKESKLDLVTIAGVILLLACAVFIALDLLDITRQPQPPPFLGDFVPEKQEVTTSFPGDLVQIEMSNGQWERRGWPAWPEPYPVPTDETHLPAPRGTARWHSCDEIRLVGGVPTNPCPMGPNGEEAAGYTWAYIGEDGLQAVDFYIRKGGSDRRLWHEEGHGRGLLVTPEEDAKTPYVFGGHTEKVGHLMEQGGRGASWKWLNRNENGDWPY